MKNLFRELGAQILVPALLLAAGAAAGAQETPPPIPYTMSAAAPAPDNSDGAPELDQQTLKQPQDQAASPPVQDQDAPLPTPAEARVLAMAERALENAKTEWGDPSVDVKIQLDTESSCTLGSKPTVMAVTQPVYIEKPSLKFVSAITTLNFKCQWNEGLLRLILLHEYRHGLRLEYDAELLKKYAVQMSRDKKGESPLTDTLSKKTGEKDEDHVHSKDQHSVMNSRVERTTALFWVIKLPSQKPFITDGDRAALASEQTHWAKTRLTENKMAADKNKKPPAEKIYHFTEGDLEASIERVKEKLGVFSPIGIQWGENFESCEEKDAPGGWHIDSFYRSQSQLITDQPESVRDQPEPVTESKDSEQKTYDVHFTIDMNKECIFSSPDHPQHIKGAIQMDDVVEAWYKALAMGISSSKTYAVAPKKRSATKPIHSTQKVSSPAQTLSIAR